MTPSSDPSHLPSAVVSTRHRVKEDGPRRTGITLGLFEKRLDGDDSLMELARLRFQQAGMGAEMHAGRPGQLEENLRFRPAAETAVVVHLSRDMNLTEGLSRQRIGEFASNFAGRVYGLVLHDHADLALRPEDYVRAAREMNAALLQVERAPMLFIEYAAGLEPDVFSQFFGEVRDLSRISACIDTGHVGIWRARKAYAQKHPGEDICLLKSQPSSLPPLMPDIETAVGSALPAVLDLIEVLGSFEKPIHFHLHDGHPLSTFSPFGVSDHLSFLSEIPLPFEYCGRRSTPLMFGPDGLSQIVSKALDSIRAERVSFTLEIHPTNERTPLGDAAPLFGHWTEKTNAEIMNHWLYTLGLNHALLIDAFARQVPDARPPRGTAGGGGRDT